MRPWFTTEQLSPDTWVISEYRHWEETHCYLLTGADRALLIDTGLGICNIYEEVRRLTDKPATAIATHIHWDHIGGHKYFPDFYAHEAELPWLQGEFPLSIETVREMVLDRCEAPEGFDATTYQMFQGTPTRILKGGEVLDLGGRAVQALHTPGHSPGHLCFWEEEQGALYTGDLVYLDTLFAYYPSTDPEAYLDSLELIAALPARRVLPAHHSLEVPADTPAQMRDALRQLKREGKLHHGAGVFQYEGWGIWL